MHAQWRRRTERLRSEDAGLGLILIIGVSVFIFVIAATAVAVAVNAMAQSRERTAFEVSLAVAEAGIDRTLADVQGAYTDANADAPAPAPGSSWCTGATVGFPTSGDGVDGVFSTEAAERTWARTQLDALVATGTCVQSDERGEYVVLKPPSSNVKYGRVYTLSALPSFADPARTRLVKTEYIFMPYRPTHAILTAGPLSISASTTVTAAAGVDPTKASVHSNATVTGVGNPTVTGPVTSTSPSAFSSANFSSNPGGAVTIKGVQSIPEVSAVKFYKRAPASDASAMAEWYDLCAGGVVRPYAFATSVPCTSASTIGTATSSVGVRGWTYESASRTWTASKNTLPGTYYAHEANVDVGTGNGTIARLTVIASAENPTSCGSKRYGNINWDHYDLTAPAFNNTWMFADTDLVTHANWKAGSKVAPVVSGMFIAGDQVQLETSSAGAVGSVVSANQCSTPSPKGLITTSEVKNPSIYFDPNSEAPFASVITTSLWLDYSGG